MSSSTAPVRAHRNRRTQTQTPRAHALAGAVAATLAAATAQAQAPVPESARVLEEIIVTAERREQSLQDLPISVTVFSGEELMQRGINNLSNIQFAAPSVAINTVNRSTFINIRGVGIAQSAPTSAPGVAYYIDGQLVPHEQHISQSFYDIASIEVLRGPQGTLTGQNSTGGAIYVRTPDPLQGGYSFDVDQTFGNFDWSRTVAAANLGFSENVGLRIAAVREERDSFTRNIGPSPSTPGDIGLDAVRANLGLKLLDGRLRANFRGEYYDFDSDNSAIKNRNDLVTSDPFVIEEDAISFLRQRGWRASSELRYSLTDGIDVRGLYSYQDSSTVDQTDGDRSATALPRPPNTNLGRVSWARTNFLTQIWELNLLSTGDGPFQWVLGGFSMRDDVPVWLLRDNNNVVDFVSSTSTIIARADNESDSVFGQANWFFDPRWEAVLGLRYSQDSQAYWRVVVPGGPNDFLGEPAESEEVTGKAGLNFHATDDTMYYATISRGYKAGGKNLTPNTPDYSPETNLVYEIGAKTTLMDGRLRFNGDVFYSDYEDIQLSSLFNNLPLQQNAASGESYGAELEVAGRFGDLGWDVGVGYLHGEFAEDTTIVNTTTNRPELVRSGDTLPYSPKLTFNAGVQYTFRWGDVEITPRMQYAHTDEQLTTPFPSFVSIMPARDLVDLRIAIVPSTRWRLEAFCTNLNDEVYVASQIGNATSADGGIIYGAPRQYGLRVAFSSGR